MKSVQQIGNNFLRLQLRNLNGYRENEVDVFIPSERTVFRNVWKKSIMGVFTNDICINNVLKEIGIKSYSEVDCCSYRKNRELVQALVQKIHKSTGNKNVGGYFIRTINPAERLY